MTVAPRHRTRIGGLLLVALMAASCATAPDAPVAGDPAPTPTSEPAAPAFVQEGGPVVVGQIPTMGDSLVSLAVGADLFADNGLTVEVARADSTGDLLPLLVTGELDVLTLGVVPAAFNALGEGATFRAVAGGAVFAPEGCGYRALAMLPETRDRLDFTDPASLRGLVVGGTFRALASRRYLDALVVRWGLAPEDVETVVLERAAEATALVGGEVDAIVALEPFLTALEDSVGAVRLFPQHQVTPGDVSTFLVFGERLLNDRELGARVLAVYLAAADRYALGATSENVAVLSDATGIEPDLLARMCWPTIDPDGPSMEAAITDMQEYGVAAGEIDAVVPPADLWDHSLADRARALLADGTVRP